MGFPQRSSWLRWLLYWLPAIVAVVVIGFESTSTMSAANTSRWIRPILVSVFGPISTAHLNEVDAILRKAGHVIGYGLVSVAFFHGWKSSLKNSPGARSSWGRSAILAVVCAFLVACGDETHQHFLPNRTGSPIDVCIDTAGAIVAQLLLLTGRSHISKWPVYRRSHRSRPPEAFTTLSANSGSHRE